MPSAKWANTPVFVVDLATGSDQNSGADFAHALKTEAEAFRRKGIVGGIDGPRTRYQMEARALTGLTDDSLRCVYYTEYASASEYLVTANGATTSAAVLGAPGILRINDGLGAAKHGAIVSPPSLNTNNWCSSLAGKRWYIVAQCRIPTLTPDTHSRFMWFSFGNLFSYFIAAGINCTQQTAKLAFGLNTTDGGSPLMPAINTALSTISPTVGQFTNCRVYYNGETVYGSFNYESWVTIGTTSSLNSGACSSFYWQSQPSASGQADQMDADHHGLWVEA